MRTIKYIFIILLSGAINGFEVYAQETATLANTSLRPEASVYVFSNFSYSQTVSSSDVSFTKITNPSINKIDFADLIKLEINPGSVHPIKQSYSVKMECQYQTPAPGIADFLLSALPEGGNIFHLTIDYDTTPGSTYKAKDCYKFKGSDFYNVTVTSVEIKSHNRILIWDSDSIEMMNIYDNLILTANIDASVDYNITNANIPPTIYLHDFGGALRGFNSNTNELCLDWSTIEWADEYQLEWTYINDNKTPPEGATTIQHFLPGELQTPDFRFNATRVLLGKNCNSYCISLIYESGYLVYRVRAIALKGENRDMPIYGAWSQELSPSNYFRISPAYEMDLKNWQYIASFAEDGKRKEVVNFLDGTLRSRQSVTRINTEKTIIAGETVYDSQGRPAISILPAPVKEVKPSSTSQPNPFGNNNGVLGTTLNYNISAVGSVSIPGVTLGLTNPENLFTQQGSPTSLLKYYVNLNTDDARVEYQAIDFDLDNALPDGYEAKPMSTDNGASNYYSPANNDQSKQQQFLPDAEGYPFVQTEWMDDNTGRLRRQGGVGKKFQLGSGHETFYYYGVPAQMELDRVFGNNVGYAEHYKKTVVSDANGQLAVSYTNLAGKTIATALAGATPEGLKPLIENPPVEITFDLLDRTMQRQGNTLVSVKNIVITLDNTNTEFNYHLDPLTFNDNSCGNNICYDCIYNLKISVIDEHGIRVADTAIHIGTFASQCRHSNSINYLFKCTLNKGTYTVAKSLEVDEGALDLYIQDYVLKNKNCIKSISEKIKRDHEKDVNPDACDMTCGVMQSKMAAFPATGNLTITDGELSYTLTEEDKNNLLADVDKVCPDSAGDPCKTAEIGMLNDLRPGGQYAEYRVQSATGNPDDNIQPGAFIYSVLNPANALPANTPAHPANWKHPAYEYKDEYGNTAYIELNPDNTPLHSGDPILNDGKKFIKPIQLQMVSDFIKYWKNSWAESLLPYHPENCYLDYCHHNPGFSVYSDSLNAIDNFEEAKLKGYVNNNNQFDLIGKDPYCVLPSHKTALENKLSSYYFDPITRQFFSLSKVVYMAVFCRRFADDIVAASACVAPDFNFSGGDELQRKKAWQYYRALYLNERSLLFSEQRKQYVHNAGCMDNAQIGNDTSTLPDNPTPQQILGHKVKRFPDPKDVLKLLPVDTGQMEEYVDNAIFNQCKKCPVVNDLQLLLTQIIFDKKLTSTFSIYDYYNIPLSIKHSFANSTAGSYQWKPLDYKDSLIISISADKGNSLACKIKLAWKKSVKEPKPVPAFNDIVSFTCFQSLPDKSANPLGGFFAKAIIKDGSYAELYGNISCANLSDCKPPGNCAGTQVADSLKKFLDYLFSSDNVIQGKSFLIYQNKPLSRPEWFPKILADQFKNADSFSWKLAPGYTAEASSFDATLEVKGKFPVSDYTDEFGQYYYCKFHFEMIDPNQKFNRKFNVADIKPDNSFAIGSCDNLHFIITAKPTKGPSFEIKGSSCFVTGNCCTNKNGSDMSFLCCPDLPQVPAPKDNCEELNKKMVERNANRDYDEWLTGHIAAIRARYIDHCLGAVETFTAKYLLDVYHYTLYYYDQSGALVKTVPPKGVHIFKQDTCLLVEQARKNERLPIYADAYHKLYSTYKYNTLGELVEKTSPDAGTVKTWYDRLGRPVVSQDAKQATAPEGKKYSYILYDSLGRVKESGELKPDATKAHNVMTNAIGRDDDALKHWINNVPVRYEVTRIIYDKPLKAEIDNSFKQHKQFLRNRVATTFITTEYNPRNADFEVPYDHATHYSYDIHGNVKELIQENNKVDLAAQKRKHIEYDYDLVSGLVNQVTYQHGQPDCFMHRYNYDADNRITSVQTSTDSVWWDNDMSYYYYKHGPLARKVLGDEHVQGMDYAYTLQGWLKGINSNALTVENDMGHDGLENIDHRIFAPKDVFGFTMNYYQNDYKPIKDFGKQNFFPEVAVAQNGLYNGNINSTVISMDAFTGTDKVQMRSYCYDQLNRLLSMDTYNQFGENKITGAVIQDYKMALTYDANGNILSLLRNGTGTSLIMDNLTYKYPDAENNNKLGYVTDAVANSAYADDLESQSANNYDYDANGNLIKDAAENIADIQWNMRGKMLSMKKNDKLVKFSYDALGRRAYKETDSVKTYYVTDATGNIMAIYNYKNNDFTWQCSPIYGSGRIGIYNANKKLNVPPNDSVYFTRGLREYELTDHLGNVLATVSDRRLVNIKSESSEPYTSIALPNDPYYRSSNFEYTTDLTSAHDYYPFGMMMPERGFSSPHGGGREGALFAYNGMQTDNDLKGEGNSYTTEFRQLDPRIGRWLSVDPLTNMFSDINPFNSFSNNPIINSDPTGKQDWSEHAWVQGPADAPMTQEQFDRFAMSEYRNLCSENNNFRSQTEEADRLQTLLNQPISDDDRAIVEQQYNIAIDNIANEWGDALRARYGNIRIVESEAQVHEYYQQREAERAAHEDHEEESDALEIAHQDLEMAHHTVEAVEFTHLVAHRHLPNFNAPPGPLSIAGAALSTGVMVTAITQDAEVNMSEGRRDYRSLGHIAAGVAFAVPSAGTIIQGIFNKAENWIFGSLTPDERPSFGSVRGCRGASCDGQTITEDQHHEFPNYWGSVPSAANDGSGRVRGASSLPYH